MNVEKVTKIFDAACEIHLGLQELLEEVEPEDNSGNLTPEYRSLSSALVGCKLIIDQTGRINGTIR